MSVFLHECGVDATVTFYELVDEITGFLVLQFQLADAGPRKELFQLRVNVLQIEALVWVPSDMRNVSEVGGPAYVLLRQLLLVPLLVLREIVVPSWLMYSSCLRQWCRVANTDV